MVEFASRAVYPSGMALLEIFPIGMAGMISYPKKVIIEEQGPRDGWQNERQIVPTEVKIRYINDLVDAGVERIQVTSFVHPKLVPQMADAERLLATLPRRDGVIYSGLVLNPRGIERAASSGLGHVAVSISASDTHSRRNANMSLQEADTQIAEMVKIGKRNSLTLRGGLQCVFGCRFEGKIDPNVVFDMVKRQLDLGVDEITLADTTGMANPRTIEEITGRVCEMAEGVPVYLHLHDTEGKGLANALAALQVGVRHFDTAFAGMGGCPFIKGASGNIATEDLVVMLHQMRIDTGVDVSRMARLSRSLSNYFQKDFPGRMYRIFGREDIKIVAD